MERLRGCVLHVGLEVVDDARQPARARRCSELLSQRLRVALVDERRLVGGAVVVARDVLARSSTKARPMRSHGMSAWVLLEEVVDDGA